MTPTDAYLALTLLPGIGPIRVRQLLTRFEQPQNILTASTSALQTIKGIGTEMAKLITHWQDHVDLAEEHRRIADHDIDLITLDHEDYPPSLREIHDSPFLLFVKGKLLERDRHAIAIVGARRCTHYGTEAARKLSYQLAFAGLTIISGLARGIDTAAHEAALAAQGRTIAVLGSGIGNIYPPENAALADRIAQSGAVISEFPVLYVPDKQSFPLRNRIVSGMSFGILVAEAPARSGSLITANQALDQGRNVYAVPGPIDRPTSVGCNRLIQQGATLVTDASDILEEREMLFSEDQLELTNNLFSSETQSPPTVGKLSTTLDDTEKTVYEALESSETQIDIIIQRTKLPSATVSATLLRLEMKKLAKQLPGKQFVKLT
ncbi:MAG: DNA-processing protein DprA [Verrucomicrobiales bacterium]|nr:DNA-processing protein DprA [Verrucomicrobiales bacterium]